MCGPRVAALEPLMAALQRVLSGRSVPPPSGFQNTQRRSTVTTSQNILSLFFPVVVGAKFVAVVSR